MDEKIKNAEDFALLATEEKEVATSIVAPAKAASVHAGKLKDPVAFKKLWKRSKGENDTQTCTGEAVESETGLSDRDRKSCESAWSEKHGYTLSPGRRLVSTQMAPMHTMSHALSPAPKYFPLLPVRRMKLQDGSLGAQTTDAEVQTSHNVYLKIRAFFLSLVFVNMDQQQYFNLNAAETVNDKILNYLYAYHSGGRPPVSFFCEAWDATARVFQLGVRAGKPLATLTDADATWQHHWTVYNPHPRAPPSASTTNTSTTQNRGGKGGGKAQKDPDSAASRIQQQKDRQIAKLKRELEDAQKATGRASSSAPSSGKGWKSQRRW